MYISTQSFKTFKIEKFSFSSFDLLMIFSKLTKFTFSSFYLFLILPFNAFFKYSMFFSKSIFYLILSFGVFQYWKNSLFPHITFWCFFSILFNKISSNYHLFLLIDLHLFSRKNWCHPTFVTTMRYSIPIHGI